MINISHLVGCGLAVAAWILYPANAHAQVKKDSLSKYSIRIMKKTDGKTISIDTTFETKGDFDVEAWIQKQDLLNENQKDQNITERRFMEPGDSARKHVYAYKFSSPHFKRDHDFKSRDTIIIRMDTIFMNFEKRLNDLHSPERFSWDGQAPNPGSREFHFKYLPKNDSVFNYRVNPPQGTRSYRFRYSWPDEIDKYLPQETPDKVTIIKKRHGRKIIIITHQPGKEKEENVEIRRSKDVSDVTPADKKSNVQVQKKVRVVTGSNNKTQVETHVETTDTKDGKKVIIIEEKKDAVVR